MLLQSGILGQVLTILTSDLNFCGEQALSRIVEMDRQRAQGLSISVSHFPLQYSAISSSNTSYSSITFPSHGYTQQGLKIYLFQSLWMLRNIGYV